MKYDCEIRIDVPRHQVIEYFENLENMKNWQEGLLDFEPLEGKDRQPGSKTKLHYKMGKRKIEMIETVSLNELPERFFVTYQTNGVWNEVKNYFYENNGRTLWLTQNVFRFSSFFMKTMGWLMPGAFIKQSNKYLQDFKQFAEKTYSKELSNK
jgi:hypothetical protein